MIPTALLPQRFYFLVSSNKECPISLSIRFSYSPPIYTSHRMTDDVCVREREFLDCLLMAPLTFSIRHKKASHVQRNVGSV